MLEPQPCAVVSYADMEQNHCGIIYQATNWVYTGSTKSHDKAYVVDGKRLHPMTLRDRGITDPTRWAKENNIPMVPPAEKHRYFQFVGKKYQKSAMLAKLNYPRLSVYPKCDQVRYDDGPTLHISADGRLVEVPCHNRDLFEESTDASQFSNIDLFTT